MEEGGWLKIEDGGERGGTDIVAESTDEFAWMIFIVECDFIGNETLEAIIAYVNDDTFADEREDERAEERGETVEEEYDEGLEGERI